MTTSKQRQVFHKEPIIKNLYKKEVSSFRKYQDFFIDDRRLSALVTFELLTMFFSPMPGAIGLLLRKWFFPCLFKMVGTGALWGKNIALRHAGKIQIGDRVAIDDNCILDARGAGAQGIQIGNDVVIARDTLIQGKTSWIKIGDRCIIGSQCQLTSAGGIHLGDSIQLAGQCYIGGSRYCIDSREIPIMDQGAYSEGPVIIKDDVWLGAGVIVLDGVRIGKGCVIGAGAVVREDLPDYTVAVPYQKLVMLPRGQS